MTIRDEIDRRGIHRVCHATRFDNLMSIARYGLLSRTALVESGLSVVINDVSRYDGHLDYISCSIEVPNTYYMRSVAGDEAWAIVRMDPVVLARESTKFSPVNAARERGSRIGSGIEAFRALYEPSSDGWTRYSTHAPSCPTNLQAEVLVKRIVVVARFREVLVRSKSDLDAYSSLLRQFERATGATTHLSPESFDADHVRESVRAGRIPPTRPVEW